MAEEFYIDPDKMDKFFLEFRKAGSILEDANRNLANGIEPLEGCWGDDEAGKTFEKNYAQAVSYVLTAAGQIGPGLLNTADGFESLCNDFLAVDEEAAAKMDRTIEFGE